MFWVFRVNYAENKNSTEKNMLNKEDANKIFALFFETEYAFVINLTI